MVGFHIDSSDSGITKNSARSLCLKGGLNERLMPLLFRYFQGGRGYC